MPIKEAAIRQDGNIYKGKRHHEIIKNMIETHGLPAPITREQGFVDELDIFIDRETAAKIAIESGQIEKLISPPDLYSEDLYQPNKSINKYF